MRSISEEELKQLRDKGKVNPLSVSKSLSKNKPKKKKVEEPEVQPKVVPQIPTSLEKLTSTSINTSIALLNKLDKMIESYEVIKTGPINTKWKMKVSRNSEKLIDSIDVVAS